MYKIPAVQRMLADPNLQKLVTCPCWANGWVQFPLLINFFHLNDFWVGASGEADSFIDIEPIQKLLILFQIQIFSNV